MRIDVLGILYLKPSIKAKVIKRAVEMGISKESIGCIWILSESEMIKEINGNTRLSSKLVAQVTNQKLENIIKFEIKEVV